MFISKLSNMNQKLYEVFFNWKNILATFLIIGMLTSIFLILEMMEPGGGMIAAFIVTTILTAWLFVAVFAILSSTTVMASYLSRYFRKDEDWIETFIKETTKC